MDDLDQKLIKFYLEDSRLSFSEIAAKLDADASTVRRRTNKLVKEGILDFRAETNPDLIGYPVQTYLAIRVAPGQNGIVRRALMSQENVRYARAISGQFDILALVWFESNAAIYQFLENVIGKIDGVREVQPFICLTKSKEFKK